MHVQSCCFAFFFFFDVLVAVAVVGGIIVFPKISVLSLFETTVRR